MSPTGQLRLGVAVSGGAPTIHLAAGALCAFHERGVSFQTIATAGAGALPGLLYAAPKSHRPEEALKSVVNLNVHDAIYHLLPSNFKVFHKYGPFSYLFWQLGHLIPHLSLPTEDRYRNSAKRLYNDWIDFVTAAVTPTTLNYWSKAVLTRVEVINEWVDWNGLRNFPGQFFLNSFNLQTRTLDAFTKDNLSPEAFYAALAMPWLYVPTECKGILYTEGASHDPGGLMAMYDNLGPDGPQRAALDAIIVLDTIGPDLWADPENLHEALQLTIMDPIVTLTENFAAVVALEEYVLNAIGIPYPKVYRLPFDLPSWERAKVLEWSYENALLLWDAGYNAAQRFVDDMVEVGGRPGVKSGQQAAPTRRRPAEKYRQFPGLRADSREADFFKIFGIDLPAALQSPTSTS
jgi:predicted acylesterase/phospholipase RssA